MSRQMPLNCEEALRMLAEHLDGELDAATDQRIEKHLGTCRSCFSRAEFERRLKGQIGGLRRQEVESEFEARVKTLIGRFGAADGARPANT